MISKRKIFVISALGKSIDFDTNIQAFDSNKAL